MKLTCRVIPGLETVAVREVRKLTGREIRTQRGRVLLEGEPEDVYRLNLWAGCLVRVLVELVRDRAKDPASIYERAREAPYEQYIPEGRSFAVRAKRYGDHAFSSMDVADRVGQAVIDRVRASRGDRLPVDLDDPDVIVRALQRHDRLSVGLDTTGRSLHRRGYRENRHPAPLNPTVARGMLLAAGWSGEPLLDPFCGSGTIPIEAAGMARGLRPSRLRDQFGVGQLSFFESPVFERVREEVPGWIPNSAARIVGADRSTKAIQYARENARRADVGDDVQFMLSRLDELEIPPNTDFVVTNPPFGKRTGRPYRMGDLYGTFWKRMETFETLTVVAISGNRQFEQAAPGNPVSLYPILLGERHCRIVVYER